jgi:hypothetical protein
MRPGVDVEVFGLQSRTDLNSLHGTLMKFENGRWNVVMIVSRKRCRIKEENLRVINSDRLKYVDNGLVIAKNNLLQDSYLLSVVIPYSGDQAQTVIGVKPEDDDTNLGLSIASTAKGFVNTSTHIVIISDIWLAIGDENYQGERARDMESKREAIAVWLHEPKGVLMKHVFYNRDQDENVVSFEEASESWVPYDDSTCSGNLTNVYV